MRFSSELFDLSRPSWTISILQEMYVFIHPSNPRWEIKCVAVHGCEHHIAPRSWIRVKEKAKRQMLMYQGRASNAQEERSSGKRS